MLPNTVQSLLAARIDRLGEREKRLLQRASVLGNDFAVSLLSAVVDLTEADLEESIHLLVRAEMIVEQSIYPEREYAFRHPLTRDVAYESQLRERRQHAHASVARALAERHSDKLDEIDAFLREHDLAVAACRRRNWRWAGLGRLVRSDIQFAVVPSTPINNQTELQIMDITPSTAPRQRVRATSQQLHHPDQQH